MCHWVSSLEALAEFGAWRPTTDWRARACESEQGKADGRAPCRVALETPGTVPPAW